MNARLPLVPIENRRIRIIGATVFNGVSAAPMKQGEVEYEKGVITYVGPKRRMTTSNRTDTITIDAAGGYLLPGFIDVHIHASMPNDTSPEQIQWWFPEEEAFATADSLRLTLEAGVTSARDLSGLTPGYRNAIAQGRILGPRMHLAISMLSPTGGHADPKAPNGELPVYARRATTPGWSIVDTDEEIIKTVRRLDSMGADVIKVCTTGGLSTRFDSPMSLGVPRQHISLIRRTVATLGRQPIAAHAQSREGVAEAIHGGASTIEHAFGLDDALIEEILRDNITVVPTLTVLNWTSETLSDEKRLLKSKRRDVGMHMIAHAIAAGVTIATGTDSGLSPHGRNLLELGYLVDAGMSPLQAIAAGTINGAKAMGLDDRLGSLEIGKQADMVLSSVDPMTRIHEYSDPSNIRVVWQAGRAVKDLDGIANH
ncbi:MAG: amidohydrolase family protein [Bifidobacterium tibiigranuli]|jgi:imidazolonepropionase-like amidohydrolase|uniref:metal-dependent hydrolase family protein n=1 Tax=Bifidobacterium tibiigranuli TaxID=2172043 RepID=UPI0026F31280|nr:amidohydrolase family protein [Bifidobacterium tibiigranuli]MCI1674026.1 amidohydrolase family protein [Bifidobacterium tibiigranuli]MCI1714002.1 amidohydrolase family protein [Bifidobacterium tibiigranuli]MCI1833392.1 amidohydrolase family protein [Bifidobacterium tibiigranuli]